MQYVQGIKRAAVLCVLFLATSHVAWSADARLPRGVKAVWDMSKAQTETTPTRQRICINGLWRWQPAGRDLGAVPRDKWGYFKVPGPWPRKTKGQPQQVHVHPVWAGTDVSKVRQAWYQREVVIPADWKGRRITFCTDYLNAQAKIYLDGKAAGEMRFPGRLAEITSACKPGEKQVLSVLVTSGGRGFRGLLGDVYLESTPAGPRVEDVKIDTSVRKWRISLDTAVGGLDENARYVLSAKVRDGERIVELLKSGPFRAADLKNGRTTFSDLWRPEKLWDLNTPENRYDLLLSLLDEKGNVLDEYRPVQFGFRELWVDGRDLRLNGTRIHFATIPLDNARTGPVTASYRWARMHIQILKDMGINYIYAHNYGCGAGMHMGFEEILRAADDVGMLIGFSQPQARAYKWDGANADEDNGYAEMAEFYVRVAQNHPSVVLYAMSHNAVGFAQQQNPDHIDGIYTPWPGEKDKTRRSDRRGALALRAEAIVRKLDPTREVYHHSSGNLGNFYTSNCYLNFVPIQERADWFGHWGTEGVKPLLLVEYGEPFIPTWSDQRVWSTKRRVQWFLEEYGAQFRGDEAYRPPITPVSKRRESFNMRGVQAMYVADNWPAFRTWGVTLTNKWQWYDGWKQRDDAKIPRAQVNWDDIQKPGYSLDSNAITMGWNRWLAQYDESGYDRNVLGDALVHYNTPLFAYIAGKPGAFTEKGHNFHPGEIVRKQVVILNDSRSTVDCECSWSLELPRALTGRRAVRVATGEQERMPITLHLPADVKPGTYPLKLTATYSTGVTQTDSLDIEVVERTPKTAVQARVAVLDPKGETRKLLMSMGVPFSAVKAGDGLAGYDLVIIGKHALQTNGPEVDLSQVRQGQKVIIFEQTTDVLERRMGFRVQEYVLRRVFARVPEHPLLAGLTTKNLHDWHGEGTTVPPRLKVKMPNPSEYPQVQWCGITVPHTWRCGCRGSVASALIEKPATGDFLPLVDGGFGLQYSPLMVYREGAGMVLFCQLDVTGRSESDPAAERLAHNIVTYAASWKAPEANRVVVYAGEAAGKTHLQKMKLRVIDFTPAALTGEVVLVVGPGGERALRAHAKAVGAWLGNGGRLIAVGLDERKANAFLPFKVTMKSADYLTDYFERKVHGEPGLSALAGIGPADLYTRVTRKLPLVVGGAKPLGNGVLAQAEGQNVVFCQLVPWQFDYRPGGKEESDFNIKPTYRRSSFVLRRILANMGVSGGVSLLRNIEEPIAGAAAEDIRGVCWLEGVEQRDTGGAALEPWRGDQTAGTRLKELILPKVWKGLPVGKAAAPGGWEYAGFDDGKWREIKVPGMWEDEFKDLVNLDGVFLYRVKFEVPAELAAADVTVMLGAIDDEDWTYLNGKLIGSVTQKTNPDNYWQAPRKYKLPKGLLKPGTNVLAVKVNDLRQAGGIKAGILKGRGASSERWLSGLYVDKPEKLDDPYRYFCW